MPIKYWKKTDYLAGSSPLRRQILIVIHGSPARHPARQGTAAQGAWPIAHSSGGEHQQCLHPMGTVVDASLHKRNSSDIPSAPTSGVGGYRRNSFWWGLNTHGSICVYRHGEPSGRRQQAQAMWLTTKPSSPPGIQLHEVPKIKTMAVFHVVISIVA